MRRALCQRRLNAQAAGGYIACHGLSDTYELLPEQAMVLADKDSPLYIPHAWNVPASMWFDEPKSLEAFRTGKGVAWGEHDRRLSCGSAAFFRNGFRAALVPQWLPALDGVVDQLDAGIAVADVGCRYGHSTLLMAEAFPNSRFHGFDTHAASLDEARHNAAAAEVSDRVEFSLSRANVYPDGGCGLICLFDILHDLGDAVAAALPIAGFTVIEAADLAEAVRLVSQTPCAVAHGVVEVWPLKGT